MEKKIIFKRYGIILRQLSLEDIEKVRIWRNSSEISQFMEYRKYISKNDQTKWFHSINNKYNYYFIINVNSEDIGLANVKDINFPKKKGESGIFLLKKHWGSVTAALSSLALYDFIFEKLELNQVQGKVLKNNLRAINYNKKIGFHFFTSNDNIDNLSCLLKKNDYLKKTAKLRKYYSNYSPTW